MLQRWPVIYVTYMTVMSPKVRPGQLVIRYCIYAVREGGGGGGGLGVVHGEEQGDVPGARRKERDLPLEELHIVLPHVGAASHLAVRPHVGGGRASQVQ